MPIDVQCAACSQRLRVGDDLAGKQVNCPKCKAKVSIPVSTPATHAAQANAAPANVSTSASLDGKPKLGGVRVATPAATKSAAPTASAAPAIATEPSRSAASAIAPAKPKTPVASAAPAAPPDEWHMQTADGQRYGPISKSELDSWLAEDRIPADSQLLPPGASKWVAATQIYPSLAPVVQQPPTPTTQPPALPFSGAMSSAPRFPSVERSPSAARASVPSFPAAAAAPSAPNLFNPPAISERSASFQSDISGAPASHRKILSETRIWTVVVSVIFFLAGPLAVVGGIIGLINTLGLLGRLTISALFMKILTAFGNMGVGTLEIFMGVWLVTYTVKVSRYLDSGRMRDLEAAFEAHRGFWRALGGLTIAMLALMVIAFLFGLIVAGAALRF